MYQRLKPISAQQQRGITLIESLIALVVAALGVLGVVGVQMRTLTDTTTTVRRAQAIQLIEDLGERLRVNPNALSNPSAYISAFTDTPTAAKDCSSAACSRTELANYDLSTWKTAVSKLLPLGQASIFDASAETDNTNRRQLGVMISWRENERDTSTAYKDDIDATKVRAADGSLSNGAGSAATCPAGRTCQLQFLPIAARCAPYAAGSGGFQYFCPGS